MSDQSRGNSPFRLISSINLDLHEILVVGGGNVALRKIDTLTRCGAKVKAVSPEAADELKNMAADGRIAWEQRDAAADDFASHRFAVLAVPREVCGGLARMARDAGCAVDVCADGTAGDFALCAQFELDGCFVGVSSGGADPARAASAKRRILGASSAQLSLLTRKSPLARAQAAILTEVLKSAGRSASIRVVESHGDKDRRSALSSFGFGAFVKALEDELLLGRGDCAVHSMKDVPTVLAEGCALAAALKRDSVCDVLVTSCGGGLDTLGPGSLVGTSSVRRAAQIRYLRPDLRCVNCRGNVETRLEKLSSGEVDAIVLAEAGLNRLGQRVPYVRLPFVTSAGQGAIAVETLVGSGAEITLRALSHLPTWYEVTAEREFLSRLAFGCVCPVGVNAEFVSGSMEITAEVYPDDGGAPERATARGGVASEGDALALGAGLWEAMRGGPIVQEITRRAVR